MSKLNRFDFGWLKNLAKSAWIFGKKNATSLMNGGSIILGWSAVYVFWTEALKAEEFIKKQEEHMPDDKKLPGKDRLLIYAKFCWPAGLMGLSSTGLSLYSHKLDADQIASALMLTQFYKDKNAEMKVENDRLKEEIKPKKLQEIEDELIEKQYPKEEIKKCMETVPGKGNTLFIDTSTKRKFRGDIVDVTKGIMKADEYLRSTRRTMVLEMLVKRPKDPFFASSGPVYDMSPDNYDQLVDSDEFSNVYTTMRLDEFLEYIGEIEDTEGSYAPGLCDLLEFRCYCSGYPALEPSEIMHYKNYTDPESGIPAVCFLDYTDLLNGSGSLLDRTL